MPCSRWSGSPERTISTPPILDNPRHRNLALTESHGQSEKTHCCGSRKWFAASQPSAHSENATPARCLRSPAGAVVDRIGGDRNRRRGGGVGTAEAARQEHADA